MSAIKAGDLVMVVKPAPCCGNGTLGYVGTVSFCRPSLGGHGLKCFYCGSMYDAPIVAGLVNHDVGVVAIWRLIRIDPPARPESVETEREVTA